jgi:hypothetical protein
VTVKGAMSGTTVRAAANIKSLTVAAMTNSNVFVAVTGSALPASAADFNGNASIGTLSVKSMAGSNVAAMTLGKLSVKSLSTSGGGFAAHVITSMTAKLTTGKQLKLSKVASPDVLTTQLAKTGATSLGSLAIRIV